MTNPISGGMNFSTIAEIEAYAEHHELTVDYVIEEFVIEGYLVQIWPNGDDAVPV